MHTLAILADIHGNTFALDAVVEDIAKRGYAEVIVAGDLVGRGPDGAAVIDRVQALGWPSIRGNHEDYALNFLRREVPEAWWQEDIWSASRWMAERLTHHKTYMEELPLEITPSQGPPMRIVHGTPASNNQGIGPWTPEADVLGHLATIKEDILVCAHTHRPLHLHTSKGQVINTGSVGLPFNGDWRAQYVGFEVRDGRWEVTFHQVPYDRDGYLERYQTSGFLVEGGLTAKLLKMEVETARAHLVPFQKWAVQNNHPQDESSFETWMEVRRKKAK